MEQLLGRVLLWAHKAISEMVPNLNMQLLSIPHMIWEGRCHHPHEPGDSAWGTHTDRTWIPFRSIWVPKPKFFSRHPQMSNVPCGNILDSLGLGWVKASAFGGSDIDCPVNITLGNSCYGTDLNFKFKDLTNEWPLIKMDHQVEKK
jgi:hypothetical protein